MRRRERGRRREEEGEREKEREKEREGEGRRREKKRERKREGGEVTDSLTINNGMNMIDFVFPVCQKQSRAEVVIKEL
jgi:hypothetical protein